MQYVLYEGNARRKLGLKWLCGVEEEAADKRFMFYIEVAIGSHSWKVKDRGQPA